MEMLQNKNYPLQHTFPLEKFISGKEMLNRHEYRFNQFNARPLVNKLREGEIF